MFHFVSTYENVEKQIAPASSSGQNVILNSEECEWIYKCVCVCVGINIHIPLRLGSIQTGRANVKTTAPVLYRNYNYAACHVLSRQTDADASSLNRP